MNELTSAERAELFSRHGQSFLRGEVIFREQTSADACYFVQSGRVRLVKHGRNVERSYAILGPGEIFGEEVLADGVLRNASAVALDDADVFVIDRGIFRELMRSRADVAERVAAGLIRRVRDLEDQLESSLLPDLSSRVVHVLLRAISNAPRKGIRVELALGPADLAGRIGVDVDSLKEIMIDLESSGYLDLFEDRISIKEPGALARLYELLGSKERIRSGAI